MEMTKLIATNMVVPDKKGSDSTAAETGPGLLPGVYWPIGLLLTMLFAGVWYAVVKLKRYRAMNRMLTSELESEKICMAQLSEEKEFLVREIHHRVKNNLQIMMSLLNMQATYLNSNEAHTAVRNSGHRLFAISLVHQKLYQSDSLSRIDIPVYLHELGQYLQYEYGGTERVALRIDAGPLYLDVNSAIPLGLIVHEALSNAFKHGFPNGRKGSVSIQLQSADDFQYLLQISDDGAGFMEGFDIKANNSLGQSLMNGLSGQLRGQLTIENHNGVTVSLAFPKDTGVHSGLLVHFKETTTL